jgi:hypothetical protein
MDHEEERAILVDESAEETRNPLLGRRKIVAGVLGTLALLVCALSMAATTSNSRSSTITIRALLEHPDTIDIVTDNLMAIDDRCSTMERKRLRASVEEAAHNKVTKLHEQEPELDLTEVPEERRIVALRMLRSLGDARLHRIRRAIMEAIRTTVDSQVHEHHQPHETLKRHLVAKLQPHAEEIRELHDTYFMHLPRGPVGRGAVIQPKHFDHLDLVQSFDRLYAQLPTKSSLTDVVPIRKLKQEDDDDEIDIDIDVDSMVDDLHDFASDAQEPLTDVTNMELDMIKGVTGGSINSSRPVYKGNSTDDCIDHSMEEGTDTDFGTCMRVAFQTGEDL